MEEFYRFRQSNTRNRSRLTWIVVAILIIAFIIFAAIYFADVNRAGITDNITVELSNTDKIIIERISQFFEVPKDEKPTIVEVKDVAKLDKHFQNKNIALGDKIVDYPQTGFSILYRPTTNKVIWVYSKVGGEE